MASHTTLIDIARACGVSRATVSLVLHNSPLPAKATRARVEAELKRQGYVYNRAAGSLRTRASSSVALVINDLSNPYFAEFAVGVDDALSEVGYVTLLSSTNESVKRQQRALQSLLEHNPAGIILSPAEDSDGEKLANVIGNSTPVVVFNRAPPHAHWAATHWDYMELDNTYGARVATELLISKGHRRIAFFGGHAYSSSCRERRQGYALAMQSAGIKIDPAWIFETTPTRIDAATHAHYLFTHAPSITAAVCYNDTVAIGLMLGAAALGRHPGKDFAVTGFDDIPEASVSFPPLATLATDPRACGRRAAQRILARNHDPGAAATRSVASVELVIRASACPPPIS